MGYGLDRVMQTAAALPAVAEDLVVLQPGEGVLDTVARADRRVAGGLCVGCVAANPSE